MAEGKRFYWLKLKEDFFRQKEIKKLRKLAGGDTYTVIYLKLLLRSLKDCGRLYYEGVEENFACELALDIDEDEDNVKMCVAFLLANNILTQNQPDEYELLTAGEMTGSEGYSAQRMRRMRGRKQLASQSDSTVTASDEEIDIEKDKEIEKEIEREKKRKRFTPPTLEEVENYAKEKGWTADQFSPERFVDFYASKGWRVGRDPMKDWKASARGWVSRDRQDTKAPGRGSQPNAALNYQQREYRAEDFGDDFFVDLDKYGE